MLLSVNLGGARMGEIIENEVMEEIPEELEPEIIERKNPLTVISKNTFGEYTVHDIQQNSSWGKNPYEDYAVVPDDMVEDILATRGFCEIELNEEETEVVSFTALEIPDIPEPEAELTVEEKLEQFEAEQTEFNAEVLYEMSLMQLGLM